MWGICGWSGWLVMLVFAATITHKFHTSSGMNIGRGACWVWASTYGSHHHTRIMGTLDISITWGHVATHFTALFTVIWGVGHTEGTES